MFLKQNDKTAIYFTGFTDSTSKSIKNVQEVLGQHAHHFIQNHVVATDNLARFCTLSGYTCSFRSVLTRFVVKYR